MVHGGPVVHPSVDHGRARPLVAQTLLEGGHPAAGVPHLRWRRMAQLLVIDLAPHLLASSPDGCRDGIVVDGLVAAWDDLAGGSEAADGRVGP